MEFMDVVSKRRSIRKYKSDPVPKEDIEYVVEAARLAPSWANSQCFKLVVVTDPKVKAELAKAGNGWIEHAPAIIAACADPSKPGTKGDQEYYMLDVGIAMAHFFLAAKEMGWSGTWHVTGFDPAKVAVEHAIPDGYEVLGVYKE